MMWQAMLIAASIIGSSVGEQPIQLVVEAAGEGVQLRVVGNATREVAVDYRLEVESGDRGNVNRSAQSGRARLVPGQEAELVRLRLGRAAAGNWVARMEVRLEDGTEYEQVKRANGEGIR